MSKTITIYVQDGKTSELLLRNILAVIDQINSRGYHVEVNKITKRNPLPEKYSRGVLPIAEIVDKPYYGNAIMDAIYKRVIGNKLPAAEPADDDVEKYWSGQIVAGKDADGDVIWNRDDDRADDDSIDYNRRIAEITARKSHTQNLHSDRHRKARAKKYAKTKKSTKRRGAEPESDPESDSDPEDNIEPYNPGHTPQYSEQEFNDRVQDAWRKSILD